MLLYYLLNDKMKNKNLKKKKQKLWNNCSYKILGEIKQMACRSKETGNRGAGFDTLFTTVLATLLWATVPC